MTLPGDAIRKVPAIEFRYSPSQTVGKRTSSVITGSTYIFTAITRPSDVRMAQIVRLVQYQEVTLNGIYAHSYG